MTTDPRARSARPLLPAATACLVAGCGTDGPRFAPVSGRVTVRVEPATQGTVTFFPVDPKIPNPSMGAVGPDGSYTLQTRKPGDGVRPGAYRAAVALDPGPDTMEEVVATSDRRGPADPLRKYEDPLTSGLTAIVEPGRNEIPLDLR